MNIHKIKPIKLNEKTAYLTGVIIGDGHISNSTKSKTDKSKDYRIVIDIADKEYLVAISNMIKSIISTRSVPKAPKKYGNRKERLYIQFRNKSFFYFLTKDMGVPNGNKSSIVRIPNKIRISSKGIRKHFLAGLFDTDGGLRGNTLGFTTASQNLSFDIGILLEEFSIKHYLEKWENKKYNKVYYGVKIKKLEIGKFLKMFPFRNKEKLVKICSRFNAEVPEWPNGTVDS